MPGEPTMERVREIAEYRPIYSSVVPPQEREAIALARRVIALEALARDILADLGDTIDALSHHAICSIGGAVEDPKFLAFHARLDAIIGGEG